MRVYTRIGIVCSLANQHCIQDKQNLLDSEGYVQTAQQALVVKELFSQC